MTDRHRTNRNASGGGAIRHLALFTAAATVTAGVVAGVGSLISSQLTDEPVRNEVLVGCGVSWLASCVGAIPLSLAASARSKQMANAILGSMVTRFFIVLLLVVPLVLSGWFDRTALVLSVAVSYLFLLAVDTFVAVRTMNRLDKAELK